MVTEPMGPVCRRQRHRRRWCGVLSTDAVARRLTADGDLDISAGRTQFVAGLEGVAAGIKARLDLIRGEFFADRFAGMPYLEGIYVPARDALLGQAFDESKVRTAYAAAILSTPGVYRTKRLDIAFNNRTRKCSVTYVASTIFGDTAVTTVEV